MSSTIASSILRKFSAWRPSLEANGMAPILVTPSTTWATSGPKSSSSGQSSSGCPRRRRGAGRRRWPPRPAACRPAGWPPRAGAPDTARPSGGPGPCVRGPKRRTPASTARRRRQGYWRGPCRRDPRTESSRWCLTSVGCGSGTVSDPTRRTRRPMIPCRLDGPGSLDRLRGAHYTARIAASFRPDSRGTYRHVEGFSDEPRGHRRCAEPEPRRLRTVRQAEGEQALQGRQRPVRPTGLPQRRCGVPRAPSKRTRT